jgi:hypothetical protein
VVRFVAAALGCTYAFSESMMQAKDVEAGVAVDDKKGGGDSGSGISATGLKVLVLQAVQNCSKNLIMRYAVQVRAPRPLRKTLHGLDIVGIIPREKKTAKTLKSAPKRLRQPPGAGLHSTGSDFRDGRHNFSATSACVMMNVVW